MKTILNIYTIFLFAFAFTLSSQAQQISKGAIETIAFGSCNKHNLPQPLWKYILRDQPDVWIWLGDNVYGDTHDMNLLRSKYEAQNEIPDYKKLKSTSKIIGVWDDHDYGINDGGKFYAQKQESQQIMLDFLNVPKDAIERKREGVYSSHDFGMGDNAVKIILLDARYHRDTLLKKDNAYIPNTEGSILGQAQWEWLEKELMTSKATVTIIAGGIQFIPTEHPFEKWSNFPKEREKLLDLIAKSKVKNPILLSGDHHIAEVSVLKDYRFPQGLYEITSSGLTHTWNEYRDEYNPYRSGKLIANLHYGKADFDWEVKCVTYQIKGENGQVYLEQKIIID